MSFSHFAKKHLPVNSDVKEKKTITAIIVTDTVLHNGLGCGVLGAAFRRFIRPTMVLNKFLIVDRIKVDFSSA